MKILWITNSLAFPDICNALNIPEPQLGGWMKSMLISISSMYPDLQFGIATLYTGTKQLIKRDTRMLLIIVFREIRQLRIIKS